MHSKKSEAQAELMGRSSANSYATPGSPFTPPLVISVCTVYMLCFVCMCIVLYVFICNAPLLLLSFSESQTQCARKTLLG